MFARATRKCFLLWLDMSFAKLRCVCCLGLNLSALLKPPRTLSIDWFAAVRADNGWLWLNDKNVAAIFAQANDFAQRIGGERNSIDSSLTCLLAVCLSVCSVCLCLFCLSAFLSACLPFCLSLSVLSACLFCLFCLPACLSVCLLACLDGLF